MAFKTVLSVVETRASENDLKLAVDLCQRENAHLAIQLITIAIPPPESPSAPMSDTAWVEAYRNLTDQLNQRVNTINTLFAQTGVSGDIATEYLDKGSVDEAVGIRARCADIAVIGPELMANDSLKSSVLRGLFYIAQIPVLLVPKGKSATFHPKTVLLAWDGGLEASRAAHEALPLLLNAGKVHITMVTPDDSAEKRTMEPGADLAAYLARHGVNAIVDRLPRDGRRVAEVLQAHAADISADLIVIGAYSHSRLRDLIFGGVTRTMLSDARLPVFMAR